MIVLLDRTRHVRRALKELVFVPPLRIVQLRDLPDPDGVREEPLVYLLGRLDAAAEERVIPWMDRLESNGGAKVAILLPRPRGCWTAVASHPHFCGLLPWRPAIATDAMERVLASARQTLASRWGHAMLRTASLSWVFTSREAADPEQAWLLLESTLAEVIGHSGDLSCLGMAFAEALTNAVEHGNLELESSLKDGCDEGLLRFFMERERRLRDPSFGNRRVHVSVNLWGSRISILIRNEGQGYIEREDPPPPPAEREGHGLGLAMIRSLIEEVTVSENGRSILLKHRLPRRRLRARGLVPGLLGQTTASSTQRRAA